MLVILLVILLVVVTFNNQIPVEVASCNQSEVLMTHQYSSVMSNATNDCYTPRKHR